MLSLGPTYRKMLCVFSQVANCFTLISASGFEKKFTGLSNCILMVFLLQMSCEVSRSTHPCVVSLLFYFLKTNKYTSKTQLSPVIGKSEGQTLNLKLIKKYLAGRKMVFMNMVLSERSYEAPQVPKQSKNKMRIEGKGYTG